MSLKKYLKSVSGEGLGQITMEYVLLLAAIAILTIVTTSRFYMGFQDKMGGFEHDAMVKMGSGGVMSISDGV